MRFSIFSSIVCVILVVVGSVLVYFGVTQGDIGMTVTGVLDLCVGFIVADLLSIASVSKVAKDE